jgi:hypothetical protein
MKERTSKMYWKGIRQKGGKFAKARKKWKQEM